MVAALVLVLAVWDPVMLGSGPDPVLSVGCDAVGRNPALLTARQGPPGSLCFVGVRSCLRSDWLPFNMVMASLTRSLRLDSMTKRSVLDGMRGDLGGLGAQTTVELLGFHFWRLGGRVLFREEINLMIPKDIAEIVLIGNELGRVYRLSGLRSDTFKYSAVCLGTGFVPCRSRALTVSAGLTASWLHGIRYRRTLMSDGQLIAGQRYVSASYQSEVQLSSGGDGFALDYGLALDLGKNWRAGIHASNLPGIIFWKRNCSVRSTSATLDSSDLWALLQAGALESLYHASTSVEPVSGFSSRLPAELAVGLGFVGSASFGASLVGGWTAGGFASATRCFAGTRLAVRILRTVALGADLTWLAQVGSIARLHLGLRTRGLTTAVSFQVPVEQYRRATEATAEFRLGYVY